MIEVCTVGGFEEVGKNMSAVKFGDDVFLLDCGIHLPAIIDMAEEEKTGRHSTEKLRRIGALPNDLVVEKLGWKDKVVAIIISHAHLDHVGALPYLAQRYPKATIYGTPFTMEVFKAICEDEKITVKNKIKYVKPDSTEIIKGKSQDYKVDFVHTTHSTIECIFPAIHSKEGSLLYALDFKFDNFPTMENPPNYKKLRELSRKGIDVLIVDSLYSGSDKRTPSERIARNLLEEAFSNAREKNGALFVTTFSSHIARIKSIVDFGKKTGRQIIVLGRSMNKYIHAAMNVKKCPFAGKVQLVKYRKHIDSILRRVQRDRGKYLIVCTGHQAEPGSIMDRIVSGETPFQFREGDNAIFSSSVIPVPQNILNRERMDKKIRATGARLQSDIHVSGHGSKGDLRELLQILKPKHIIPAHGSLQQEAPMIELSTELGYKFGETSHLSSNGKVLKFQNGKYRNS